MGPKNDMKISYCNWDRCDLNKKILKQYLRLTFPPKHFYCFTNATSWVMDSEYHLYNYLNKLL